MTDTVANVTLDKFCVVLSTREKRPHMIGAFHHSQRVAKKLIDTPANYQAAFDAFVKAPAGKSDGVKFSAGKRAK
jgi:hypothetical protein